MGKHRMNVRVETLSETRQLDVMFRLPNGRVFEGRYDLAGFRALVAALAPELEKVGPPGVGQDFRADMALIAARAEGEFGVSGT